jgi:hypothetical protein
MHRYLQCIQRLTAEEPYVKSQTCPRIAPLTATFTPSRQLIFFGAAHPLNFFWPTLVSAADAPRATLRNLNNV